MKTYNTRALAIVRELLCHQSVEECRGDHETNQVSCSLHGNGRKSDFQFVDGPCVLGFICGEYEVPREWRRQKQRVCWKDPNRGHSVNRERSTWKSVSPPLYGNGFVTAEDVLCGPQDQIHASAADEAHSDVDPEHGLHELEWPRTNIRNCILADVDKYDADTSRIRQMARYTMKQSRDHSRNNLQPC